MLRHYQTEKTARCDHYCNKSNAIPHATYWKYRSHSPLPSTCFSSSLLSLGLSSERCYKALCLIKTHCPTNGEAGNSRRCFTNRNDSCSLSLNWGKKKVLENIHQMHIHVHHQRGLDLGTHKSNVKCSNQELYRQQGNKELENTNTSELAQLQMICFWKTYSLALFQDFLILHSFPVAASCSTKVNVTCHSFASLWASSRRMWDEYIGKTQATICRLSPSTLGYSENNTWFNFSTLVPPALKFGCSAKLLFLSRRDN